MLNVSKEDIERLKMAHRSYKMAKTVYGKRHPTTKSYAKKLLTLKPSLSIIEETKTENVLNIWEFRNRSGQEV